MLSGISIVTGLGLAAGALLAFASKVFHVDVDKTVEEVRELLPGANCGACGYAGCDDYAAALATREVKCNLCTPGGSAVARQVSEYLGLPFEDVREKKVVLKCSGNYDTSEYIMDYEGPASCKACNTFYQGRRSCSHGCLGYGDCVKVCKFGALSVDNGLVVVNRALCTGCGACVKICPNHLFQLTVDTSLVYVGCSSHDKGAFTRKICTAGCIGCMRCQKACEYDAIVVTENLAAIDPEKCTNCQKCVEVCPTKVIHSYVQ